ncbi:MAG: tetratricopeptide repeat protein [Magnetospirillum sp. WYHS-4]
MQGNNKTLTHSGRFILGLALALAGCVSGSAEVAAPPGEPTGPAQVVGRSLTGNYLAGRHAQLDHRLDLAVDQLRGALAKDPANAELRRRTFAVMAAEGLFPEAADLGRGVAETDPADPLAAYVVAADDIRAGRYADATKRLKGMADSGINLLMAPMLTAWALAGEGRTDEAVKALDKLSETEGLRVLRHLHAALINDLAGRMAEAEKDYLAVAAAQSELTLRFTELVGSFMERTGKGDKAREFYDRYLNQSGSGRHLGPALARLKNGGLPPRDVADARAGAAESLFGIASTLRQQNLREMALVFVRLSLLLRPNYPVAQLLLATVLEGDDRLEAANAVYRSIDVKSPYSWSARLRLAGNLDGMDRTDEAVAILSAMAEEAPADPDPYIDLGDVLRARERFAEAVQAYDKAVTRLGPSLEAKHWGLLYARGIALERSKQWPRAEADFLKALEFKPDQAQVLNYLGYTWVEQGLHLERAQDMLRKAVRLKPNDGYIIDSLGWVYYRLGKYDSAVKELERAVELRPADPVINDHLGDAYWRVGRHQEARFQWRRSLALDPEPDVRQAVEGKLRDGLAEEKPIQPKGGNG